MAQAPNIRQTITWTNDVLDGFMQYSIWVMEINRPPLHGPVLKCIHYIIAKHGREKNKLDEFDLHVLWFDSSSSILLTTWVQTNIKVNLHTQNTHKTWWEAHISTSIQ